MSFHNHDTEDYNKKFNPQERERQRTANLTGGPSMNINLDVPYPTEKKVDTSLEEGDLRKTRKLMERHFGERCLNIPQTTTQYNLFLEELQQSVIWPLLSRIESLKNQLDSRI